MADGRSPLRTALPYLLLGLSVAVFVGGGALFVERAGLWGDEGDAGKASSDAQAALVVEENRLGDAVSPYLRMHADNPVHWQPWGEEAFRKAREADKLIFLSVGYYTCYRCQVMEREAFTDPGIAETLNRHFVPIKVDREQRPGVDALYMRALHVMGKRGGWPLSVFLTPELEPFSGATYLPTDKLSQTLTRLDGMWSGDRQRVEDAAARVVEGLKQMSGAVGVDGGGEIPVASHLPRGRRAVASSFQAEHGGFSGAPKFPQPSKLEFLLRYHERSGDERALEMARVTLDAMAAGGIYDQIGGGFHRYATDERWRVPHFEKMLYGNAQLLAVYTRAWRITGEARYREVAAGIVEHLAGVMTDPDTGLFYSAQSSLVDGVEGKTYTWTREQVAAALDDPGLTEIAVQRYGLDGEPEMAEEGTHVLYRARSPGEVAGQLDGVTAAEVREALDDIDRRLHEARQAREQPSVGDKHVLAWNALTIAALAEAGQAFDQPGYIERAVRAARALRSDLYDADGGPWRAIRDGRGEVRAQLIDYATLVDAYLTLAEATGEASWRKRAAATAEDMVQALWDEEHGVFARRDDPRSLLVRVPEVQDGAMPAGNSVAAGALARLAASGETRFAPYAGTVLRAYEGLLDRRPDGLPRMLTSLMIYRDAELPRSVAIPGAGAAPARADAGGAGRDAPGGSEAPGVKLADASGGTAAGKPGTLMSASKVDVSAALMSAADGPRLEVRLKIADGWHVNANPASLEFLIPTEITVLADGEPLEASPSYPEPMKLDAGLGEGPISVYEGESVIEVSLPEGAAMPDGDVTVQVQVQACNDQGRCLAPATIEEKISASGG